MLAAKRPVAASSCYMAVAAVVEEGLHIVLVEGSPAVVDSPAGDIAEEEERHRAVAVGEDNPAEEDIDSEEHRMEVVVEDSLVEGDTEEPRSHNLAEEEVLERKVSI